MIWMSLVFIIFYAAEYDAVVVDQTPTALPFLFLYNSLLKVFGAKKCMNIIFYCHFPDKMLAHQLLDTRPSFWRSLYRRPFDLWEEFCLSMCFLYCPQIFFFNFENY